MENFLIKQMKESEIQIAIDWADKEGWNPGLHDAKNFWQADPHGYFIGLLDGVPIAVGSAVVYDEHFAFCGLYIVKPEYRQQGFGIQLTHERLKYTGNRITGIDGVLENVSKYQKIGYVAAHKNIRFELTTFPQAMLYSAQVVDLKKIDFTTLENFERPYFPAKRTNFLKCWIEQADAYALGYIERDELKGYGVIRKCKKGYKIGPLFAKTPIAAQELFESLCNRVTEGPIYLDVPEINEDALKLVSQYQMKPTFEVMRMYRNGFPNMDLEGIYGITTYELG